MMKEELAKLQGTWDIVSLEVEGATMASSAFSGSQIIVEGNTFTTVSVGATYKGKLKVESSKKPKTLDLAFEEGPEKGNKSAWRICLTERSARPRSRRQRARAARKLQLCASRPPVRRGPAYAVTANLPHRYTGRSVHRRPY